jgi:AcrR family transcriptional regulator
MARTPASKIKSPWEPAEARKRERSVKRDAVLKTAVLFFNEKGFHATSLDDVAESLNVTKPTIYHYFSNKDEILFECTRQGLETIRHAVEAVANRNGSPLERLEALLHDYALFMTQDFGMCVIRTADYELSEDSRKQFRALKHEIDLMVRGLVAEGMADGSISKGDPRLVTFTLTGAMNWIARWYQPGGSISAEDAVKACVDTLMNGLTPREAARHE